MAKVKLLQFGLWLVSTLNLKVLTDIIASLALYGCQSGQMDLTGL
jgi:hypothetical protein